MTAIWHPQEKERAHCRRCDVRFCSIDALCQSINEFHGVVPTINDYLTWAQAKEAVKLD